MGFLHEWRKALGTIKNKEVNSSNWDYNDWAYFLLSLPRSCRRRTKLACLFNLNWQAVLGFLVHPSWRTTPAKHSRIAFQGITVVRHTVHSTLITYSLRRHKKKKINTEYLYFLLSSTASITDNSHTALRKQPYSAGGSRALRAPTGLTGPGQSPVAPSPVHGSGCYVTSWGCQSLSHRCHTRAGLQLPMAWPCHGPCWAKATCGPMSNTRAPSSCPSSWAGWWNGPWPPGPPLTASMGTTCSYWTCSSGETLVHVTPGQQCPLHKAVYTSTIRKIYSWRKRRKRILLQLWIPQNLHQGTISHITTFWGMSCRHEDITVLHASCHWWQSSQLLLLRDAGLSLLTDCPTVLSKEWPHNLILQLFNLKHIKGVTLFACPENAINHI